MTTNLVQTYKTSANRINLNRTAMRVALIGLFISLGIGNAWSFDHGQHYGRANVAVATGSTGSGTVYIGTPGTTSATWDCKGSANDGSSDNDTKSYSCTCTNWDDGYYFAGWNQNPTEADSYSSTSATASLSFGPATGTSSSPTEIYYYAWILGVTPTAAAGDVSFSVDNLSTTYTKTVSFTQTGGDDQADFNNATIEPKSGGGTWIHTSTTYNRTTNKVDVVFTYKSNRSTWTNAAGSRTDKATLTLSSKGNKSFSTEITASLPNVTIFAGSGGTLTRTNATETETGSVTFPVSYVDNKDDLNAPTIAKTSGEGTWDITGYSYNANTITVNYSHTGDGTYGTRASAATITLSAKAGGAPNTCNVTATYPDLAVTGGDDTGAYPLTTEDAAGTATFFVTHADALSDFTIPTAVTDATGGTWTVDAASAVYTQSTSDPSTGTVTINYTYNAGELIGVRTAQLTLTSTNGSSSYTMTLTGERAAAAEQDVSVTTSGGVTTNYDTWAEGLAAANTADGCTLKLLRDVSGLTATQEITKTMTLDLNHFTLSGTLSAAGGLLKLNTAGKTLTITDGKSEGGISVTGDVNGRISAVEILKGSLVLSKGDLTAENANTGATQANIYVATVYLAASTTMTMTAGNITARRTGASGNYCHGIYCAGTGASAASVNLTGGTITADFANGGYAIGVYAAGTSLIKDMTISGNSKIYSYAIWAQDGKLVVNGGTLSGTTSTNGARAIYTKTNPATKNALVVNNAILNATAGTTDAKGVYCQSTSATISGDPTDANIILSNVMVDAKTTGTTNAFAIFTDAGVCLLVNSGDYSATAQTTDAYAVQTSGYTAIVNGTFNATATDKIARAINVLAGITAVRNGSFNATATTEKAHTTYVASGAKLLTYGGTFHGKLLAAGSGQYATGSYITSGGTLEAQGGTFWGEIAKEGLGAAQTNYAIGVYAPAGATISIQNATLKAQTDNTYVNGAYALNIATANAASLTNCTLQATSAYQHGYAIYNNGTPLSVKNCTATVNTTYAYNYGIYNNAAASVTTTENSSFTGTSGTTYAYGGYVKNGTLTAIDCAFSAETKRTGATKADNCQLYGIYVNTGKSATLSGCTINATGSGAYGNNGYGVYVDGSADIEDCAVTVSNINSGAYAICNTGNTTAINVASGKFKAAATTGTIVETNATAAATKQKLYGGYYVHNTNLEKYLPEGYGIETLPTSAAEYAEGYRYAIRSGSNLSPVCKIGSTPYYTLEEALEFVNKNSGSSNTIVMTANYTLPAGDYTLPAKATLLIPREGQTSLESHPTRVYDSFAPSLNLKLTFASGVHMDVLGIIQTGAKQSAKGQTDGNNGMPTDKYGWLYLSAGSSVILENGSQLYSWGYITGPGEIDAKRGSTVHEFFMLKDWRGGTCTKKMNNNSQKVFPLNQYYIQNIESPIKFRPGSSELCDGTMNASSNYHEFNDVKLIGVNNSGSLFEMANEDMSEDTWVRKKYDAVNDMQIYEINSSASIGSITLTLSWSIFSYTFNSANYVLPITNNMKIHLLTGSMNITNNTELLPGAEIEIDKEATAYINSGKALYVFDIDEWNAFTGTTHTYPLSYSPSWAGSGKTCPRSKTITTDAVINVHGKFVVNGGIYTTAGGANIFSTDEDAGTIQFNVAATSGTSSVYVANNTGPTYTERPSNSAYLKNGNGTYEHTAGTAAGKTWLYYEGKWNCWEERGCFTYDAQDHPYAKPAAYVQLTRDTEDANHLYSDAATGNRRFLVDADCVWWEVEPTPYDGNKYKCVTPDHNGKYKYYEYVSGWQEATVTVTWSINGTNTNYTVLYGNAPKYLSATPSKTATSTEYYTWAGWTMGSTEGEFYAKDAELPVITSNTTFYALFETHKYSYAVTFKNYDGSVLQATRWEAGQVPYYTADTDPVKPATAALVYTFTGWSPAFTAVTGSGQVYTAQFDAGTPRTYTIQWVNYNGTVLKEEQVAYGSTPSEPVTPTRPNDTYYTYTFNAWSPAISTVSGNQTYTATYNYEKKVTKYAITFKNGSETVYTQNLQDGETPAFGGTTPTKAADAQYTYTFDGWSTTDGGDKLAALPAVAGEATYYAHFSKTENKYTVSVAAGANGAVSPASVSGIGCETASGDITATPNVGYTFVNWTLPDGVTAANGCSATSNPIHIHATAADKTITANFVARNDIEYTVKHWQQNLENNEYTLFETQNLTGTTDTEVTPAVKNYTGFTAPATQTKTIAADGSMEIAYYYTRNTYTITWVDGNGTTIATDEAVKYGATPVYTGATPTKAEDDDYTYTFNDTWSPAITSVTRDATYTAQFNAVSKETGFYVDIVDVNNSEKTLKLNVSGTEWVTAGWPYEVNGTVYYRDQAKATAAGSDKYRATDRTLTIPYTGEPGENFTVTIRNASSTLVSKHTYIIPQEIKSATTLTTDQTAPIFVKGATLTVNADIEATNIYVGHDAKLVINRGVTLTADSLFLRTNPESAAELVINESGAVAGSTKVLYTRIILSKSGYFQFGLPLSCPISAVRLSNGKTVGYKSGTGWILRYYDEDKRATTGPGDNWATLDAAASIAAGRGYEMYSGVDYYREFYFPVDLSQMTNTVHVDYTAGEQPTNNGWNVLVSPLTHTFTNTPQPEGMKISWMQLDGSFLQEPLTTVAPAMTFAYQAVKEGSLVFDGSNVTVPTLAPRRVAAVEEATRIQWMHLDIKDANGLGDQTSIYSHPTRYDQTFKMGVDEEKQSLTASRALLYSSHAYGEMAFAGVADELLEQGVALTVYSPKAQELTISMRENEWLNRMAFVWLIDKATGAQIDLLESDYSFSAEAGTTAGRFILMGAFFAPQITTDNGTVQGDDEDIKAKKFIYKDKMYIQINGVIYDATGKLVK